MREVSEHAGGGRKSITFILMALVQSTCPPNKFYWSVAFINYSHSQY